MAKRNGWITVKSIVAAVAIIVLTALIIWGLYVVRERGDVARREEAVKVAQERLDEIAKQEVKEPVTDTATQNGDSEVAVNEGNATAEPNTSGVSALPQTGPSDGMGIIGAALVVFAVASYASSVRNLRALRASNR